MFYVVKNPSPAAPRYGLLSSATTVTETDPHWQDGITYPTEICPEGSIGLFDPSCNNDGADVFTNPDEATEPAQNKPVGLSAFGDLSTFDRTDLTARVQTLLVNATSFLLEQELWNGTVGSTVGNAYLKDGTATVLQGGDPTPANHALSILGEAAAIDNAGSRFMIHAPLRVVYMWHQQLAIRREGNLFLDPMDNIVVPGIGYEGSGPEDDVDATGDTRWVFATPMVYLRLTGPDLESQYVVPSTNTRLQVVSRIASLTYDPCWVEAINVDICQLCCTPS